MRRSGEDGAEVVFGDVAPVQQAVGGLVGLRAVASSRLVAAAQGQARGPLLVGGGQQVQVLERTAELALRVQHEGALVARLDVVRLVLQDPLVDAERLAEGARVLRGVLLVQPTQVERGVRVLRRAREGLAEAGLRGLVVPVLGLQHAQEVAHDGALRMKPQRLHELTPCRRAVVSLEEALGAAELLEKRRAAGRRRCTDEREQKSQDHVLGF